MTNEVTVSSKNFLHVPYSFELATESLRSALAEHNKSGIEMGLWVIALKEHEEHGNYEKALKECGLSSSSAHRYAQRATYVLTHENEYGALSLRTLNGSKLDKLIKLPERTTSELYDENGQIAGIDPDELAGMSAKQFEILLAEKVTMIEGAEDELHHLQGQLVKSDMEKTKLLNKVEQLENDKQRLTAQPELVEQCTIMSTHWSNTSVDAINRISNLIEAMAGQQVLNESERRIGLSAIAYNLRYIHARAEQLLSDLGEISDNDIMDDINEWLTLEASTITRIETMREDMLLRHSAQESIKKNEVADKIGKRGRRNKVA